MPSHTLVFPLSSHLHLLHRYNNNRNSLCTFATGHGVSTHVSIAKTQFYAMGTRIKGTKMAVSATAAHRTSTRPSDKRNDDTQLPTFQVALMAACMSIFLSSDPVQAGLLSGSSGLESIPRPDFPQFDFLRRIQEENQSKYEAADAKFKSSSLLQELLKRSKDNAERNKEEIQNKYCERGAEWGVGDCSTVGMSKDEREAFMEMLRQKRAPR